MLLVGNRNNSDNIGTSTLPTRLCGILAPENDDNNILDTSASMQRGKEHWVLVRLKLFGNGIRTKGTSTLPTRLCGILAPDGVCFFQDCHDISFTNNTITQKFDGLFGIKVSITNGSFLPLYANLNDYGSLVINGNQIKQLPKSIENANTFVGIQISWQSYTYNNIQNPLFGITNAFKFKTIEIDNNIIESPNLDYAILVYPGAGVNTEYWEKLIIGKGNQMSKCNYSPSIDIRNSSYLIGANPLQNQWIANGVPGTLSMLSTATQGALALNKQRVADNKYKNNSLQSNAGWTLVSEMNRQVIFDDEFQQLGNLVNDSPIINVLGSNNHWINPNPLQNGAWNISNLGEAKLSSLPSQSSSNPGIIPVETISDCEIKAVYRNTGNISTYGGIIFRYSSLSSYWRYYYNNSNKRVYLETIGATTSVSFNKQVEITNPSFFVLKAILSGNMVSIFYNDLFIYSIMNSHNASLKKHGLIIKGNAYTFYCKSFKILK